MSVTAVNKSNFQKEVLSSSVPVLIDFWAAWCGPCKMLSPVIDQLAAENAGTTKFVKVNVDEEPELAQQFKVSSIPMLVLIKDGKVVSTSVGAKPKSAVEQMIR